MSVKKNGNLSRQQLLEQLRRQADEQARLIKKAEELGHDMSCVDEYNKELKRTHHEEKPEQRHGYLSLFHTR